MDGWLNLMDSGRTPQAKAVLTAIAWTPQSCIPSCRGLVPTAIFTLSHVKRKASNAGKVTLSNFAELKEEFLADISAEVLINDIPPQLIFNWDQTTIQDSGL